MDASASLKPEADITPLCLFINLKGNCYSPLQQNNKAIKYTKLPDFDFDSEAVLWRPNSYTLRPRLRRIVAIDNVDFTTPISLRSSYAVPIPPMAATRSKRKIVTISEDEEHDLHPKFSKEKRPSSVKMSDRSFDTDYKSGKQPSSRTTSRLTMPSVSKVKRSSTVKTSSKAIEADFKSDKQSTARTSARYSNSMISSKEPKIPAKSNSAYNKEVFIAQQSYRKKHSRSLSIEHSKTRHNMNERELMHYTKTVNPVSINKVIVPQSDNEHDIKNIQNLVLYNKSKTNAVLKKSPDKRNQSSIQNYSKNQHAREISTKGKVMPVIRVPIEKPNLRLKAPSSDTETEAYVAESVILAITDSANNTDSPAGLKHANIGTEPLITVDQITEMDDFELKAFCKCESSLRTETIQEIFDSLEIPNVTLTKDKPERKDAAASFNTSLPNLGEPVCTENSLKEDVSSSDISFCKSASYIFSRATLTYTSRQKINFQVVERNEEVSSNISRNSLDFPMKVVTVFKNELENKNKREHNSSDTCKEKNNSRDDYIHCLNELNSLNCSYVFNKLIKPSDIISTIRVDSGLVQNESICEQFQRELNFIDSFFESLQYLESCSLSDKIFSDNKVESLVNNSELFDSTFDARNSEYDNFLSKLENGANIDDTETIASKSLCLLNLLIRDEQRRAKNLLFVLKMRENALKDFTKSQILWLEKKKKHDNTDISTLKKKQRGALLKLQHECGEMQRMRKALLTLSEKRKVALMKTKKNIELKLNSNVDVEQIILAKRKLRRSLSADRITSPLKCFDLSSSGCEESTTPRPTSGPERILYEDPVVTSAEKCVQTGDALSNSPKQQNPEVAAEHFVAVDGGYLNILFHDLQLPQIFSSGKHYEVNEEALKNIVSATNIQNNKLNAGSDVIEKLMDQIKNRELDTSSPSTAHSLVEEFDQYYRGLDDIQHITLFSSPERSVKCFSNTEVEEQEVSVKPVAEMEPVENCSSHVLNDINYSDSKTCGCEMISIACQCSSDKESEVCSSKAQSGPLPVPVGAAAPDSLPPPDVRPSVIVTKSTSSSDIDLEGGSISSQSNPSHLPTSPSPVNTMSTPVQCEAEELRRQQLAIEREIKALEQQQCRLLVVREIPDKPPPPYTPPTEAKPKPPRMFTVDERSESAIQQHLTDPTLKLDESNDAFDSFVKDFCQESLERHKLDQSEKPWDACNLLPQKPEVDTQKLVNNTCAEIKEVLTTIQPTVVSGVASRRSDHIDDILFAEWRRCEPEWTSLHTDEAIVKNQLFESIFQKILTETIDSYKKTVSPCVVDPD